MSAVLLYAYVNPVIAVLLGALLLAEKFGLRVIMATATVFVGIAVARGGGGSESRTRPGIGRADS